MDIMDIGAELYASASLWLLNNPSAAFFVLLFLAVFLAVIGVATMAGGRGSVSRRLSSGTAAVGVDGKAPRLRQDAREGFWVGLVTEIEKRVPLVDEMRRSTMERRLIQAGFFSQGAVRSYYAIRLLLTVGLPLTVLVTAPLLPGDISNQGFAMIVLGLGVAGLYLPPLWLSRRIARRQQAIAEGFPDALDMMVVCVEAGLGLDATFNRVGAELTRAHPELAMQFALVSLELRAGKSRADALRNLADRIGRDEISSFVTLMIQSDTLGTSIAQTLSVHADEMRTRRTLRAEEKAHKLPVKLTVPLVVFILPCMITVILLPGIIGIIRTLLPAMQG